MNKVNKYKFDEVDDESVKDDTDKLDDELEDDEDDDEADESSDEEEETA